MAQKIYEEVGRWLGIAIGSLANVFNTHLFLIGGGVANAGDILFKPMKDEAFKRALPGIRDKIEIMCASARTAPKAKGIDNIETLILSEE
ncbi:unnamed protein product, partial [marine sediment metagenome]